MRIIRHKPQGKNRRERGERKGEAIIHARYSSTISARSLSSLLSLPLSSENRVPDASFTDSGIALPHPPDSNGGQGGAGGGGLVSPRPPPDERCKDSSSIVLAAPPREKKNDMHPFILPGRNKRPSLLLPQTPREARIESSDGDGIKRVKASVL